MLNKLSSIALRGIKARFVLLSIVSMVITTSCEADTVMDASNEGSTIEVEITGQLGTVHPEYLSFAIDTSFAFGLSHFWKKEKMSVIDWKNQNLITLAQHLSPAYLRLGGSKSDHISYDLDQDESYRPPNKHIESNLSLDHWNQINEFAQNTGSKLFFTLNAGPWALKKGKLDTSRFIQLLKEVSTEKYPIPTFEFGNEINAHFIFFGLKTIRSFEYAEGLKQMKRLLDRYLVNPRLAGPANGFWPKVGEPLGFLVPTSKKILKHTAKINMDLDIFTWHFYPAQSKRCAVRNRTMKKKLLLFPEKLNEVRKFSKKVNKWVKKYQPQAEIWLGESASAQCGGTEGVSDTFISSLWWLDQLGTLARDNHKVVIRQSLLGGDYALLNEDFSPRPDYWASYLWKKLMGTTVLEGVGLGLDRHYRLYAHCGKEKGVNLLAINLKNNPLKIQMDYEGPLEFYQVNPTETVWSENITINSQPLSFQNGNLTDVKKLALKLEKIPDIAAKSYAFLHFPDWKLPFCEDEGTI